VREGFKKIFNKEVQLIRDFGEEKEEKEEVKEETEEEEEKEK